MKRVVNMDVRLSPAALQHIDVLKVFEKTKNWQNFAKNGRILP